MQILYRYNNEIKKFMDFDETNPFSIISVNGKVFMYGPHRVLRKVMDGVQILIVNDEHAKQLLEFNGSIDLIEDQELRAILRAYDYRASD